MRILIVHNKYNFVGGEEAMVEIERTILQGNGHEVRVQYFDNKEINNASKLKLAYQILYNKDSENILEQTIDEFKPDVIHCHNLFYVASPSILYAAHKRKVPVVLSLHNYRLICSGTMLMRESKPCELCTTKVFPMDGVRYGCFQNSKLKTAQLTFSLGVHKLMKTWNNKVSMFIASTEFARKKFINSSLNLAPDQIIVKSNSVIDVGQSNFEERENFFLFIGRLSQEKGVEVLLNAFEDKKIKLEIIGEGPLQGLTESSASRNENIKYWGYVDRAFIISRLKKCRALIVPSICYESLPTTVLEAYAAGTPVIISDIGNLNEIVTHNYNGMHFKLNDSNDLFRVVEDFDLKKDAYRAFNDNARKTYVEKYTPEINYKNLISIYENVVRAFHDKIKIKSIVNS